MLKTRSRLNLFARLVLTLTLTLTQTAWAQSPAPQTPAKQDVTIVIQQQQVRFTTPLVVEQLHLQVRDQAGEVVFDSGAASVLEIFWPLQYADGAPLKSGLYAYTLTLKEAGKEAQARRGHFIVDRAQDRDGADKLWVTSQNTGVGTELTVARDENAIVAGATTSGERTLEQRAEGLKRTGGERGVEVEGQDQTTAAKTTVAAVTAGTAGYIAKFTSASDLGNSVLAESGGNVGIGTTSPSAKLTVQTPTASYGVTHTDGNIALGTWVGNGSTGLGGWFGTRSNHSLHFFTNDGGARMTITPAGYVGIGTANPALLSGGTGRMLAISDAHSPGVALTNIGVGGKQFFLYSRTEGVAGSGSFRIYDATNSADRFVLSNTGNVGIGSTDPQAKLEVASGSGDILRLIGYEPFLTFYDSNHGYARGAIQQVGGGLNLFADSYLSGGNPFAYLRLDNNGNVGLGTATPEAKLDVAGQTRTHSLQITGGADFAENFDVNAVSNSAAETLKVEPGMVVSIDPAHPGKLALSTQAYDYQVAGIISGAGGVKPGMMMSQAGTLADGQHPVALSGRVYCWADATNGPIKPGDMLTTSDTPGHAMKVTDRGKAQGAIIGKAMTGLQEGKGLVLVLVTLQ